ncbi:MAG: YdiU family protein [Gammaproteobacteria bacterium]|nr:YdiU family protein [Gammaproteobacteria bacterium]MBU1555905.1 YdiU family protein [Gammaproteobacteria bacterium]MBU2072663.1 YdiU family protein [Gammaproteobacteria bacterium]MBU2182203.1 YdiU family protein [Gammaproteobacteria bacterium]MBU2204817.1 YdiU family protein [Gammaproteobacteria bacterium]
MSLFCVQHSLADLGAPFSLPCNPTPVAAPQWLAFNPGLAAQLQLPESYWLTDAGLTLFSGNTLPDWVKPVAHAYAGHQFGHFVPQLGDGRALLLAELTDISGQRFDLQLKGAGQTPFSRRGDGRAPLGPVLREYLVSEAMHALGVSTTRALAAVLTGDWLQRETAEPGAIITRVAKSHIRIGSFQYIAHHGDREQLKTFADYVIQRHYPECANSANPYLALLSAVVSAQAKLIAKWMSIGFIHGVMNTDNMSIAGETIDYGPCAFMDAFNPAQVYSFIDKQGRYAWGNQPRIASWNLARFAETLLPLFAEQPEQAVEQATTALYSFNAENEAAFLQLMGEKIGLKAATKDDEGLIRDLLNLMSASKADFSQTFRLLSQSVPDASQGAAIQFADSSSWQSWCASWHARLAAQNITSEQVQQQMNNCNPALIPRNHQIARAIDLATTEGDLTLFNRLHTALKTPFAISEAQADLALPPKPEQCISNTFCGT